MRGVVARQVRIGLGLAEVVDRDDLDVVLLPAFVMRAQDVAADAAVTVDSDFDGPVLNSGTQPLGDRYYVLGREPEMLEQILGDARGAE